MIEHDLLPEERAQLGDLAPLYDQLAAHDVPAVDSARLLAMLKPLLAEQTDVEPEVNETPHHRTIWDWLRLAWAQTELLEAPFWWSSLLLTLLGVLLGVNFGGAAATLCLVLMSPLLAVIGVAYLFRPATRMLWELEQLSRIQPLEFLYARLALILTLNLALASALLLVAWTQGAQMVLWRLLLIWFGPMIGLTGIAMFCSVRWNTLAGIIAPLSVWSGLVLIGWRESVLTSTFGLPTLPSLVMQLGMSNTLLMLAGVSLVVGFVLVVESGRWVAQWR